MAEKSYKTTFAAVGAVLGITGIALQFYLTYTNRQLPAVEMVIRFFSYFTILTNALVVLYLLAASTGSSTGLTRFASRPEVGTAVTVYILVVGVVYQTVLRGLVPLDEWGRVADNIIHGLVPLYMLCYWLWFVSTKPVRLQTLPYWLIYPAAYLAYTLLHGSMANFYPYPFVNVGALGYRQVLVNSLLVLLVILLFSVLLGAVAKWRHRNQTLPA
ncbi:Pr6Pr family membrane protein [Hymenobacter volaticus]|uniref:Pr6Pr family membrane protein n=1 Tax=Hymenobacter volaticus TaxID=2932254 RepID=A0ABY4G1B7_9BACT|nr:Pr6Pr family membrane protein [Hymenobacter volaticus]UOQ64580.1 Pr6Pr family membrane protein [Hymenobacter volaticus]